MPGACSYINDQNLRMVAALISAVAAHLCMVAALVSVIGTHLCIFATEIKIKLTVLLTRRAHYLYIHPGLYPSKNY